MKQELFEQATSAFVASEDSDERALASIFGPLRDLMRASGPGRFFGNYELLELIGEGGQGLVYRARQIHVGKIVALKLVNPDDRDSSLRELRLVSDLEHPNLVRVYHVGEHEGRLYYTMQLAERGSLNRRPNFEGCRLPAVGDRATLREENRRLAGFMARIASAVAFLHEQGVTHRDLKLGNVLIDAEGRPLVIDLGLASIKDEPPDSESVGGTLPYMAPEHLAAHLGQESPFGPPGSKAEVDWARSDVYSLGVILYEMLTGHRPFEGKEGEIKAQVMDPGPAPSPSTQNERVDADLELICLKCLSKNPADRYATAKELADDLEKARDGEGISLRKRNWLTLVMLALERTAGEYQKPEYPKRWRHCLRAEAATAFVCHVGMFFLAGLHPAGVLLWLWFLALDTCAGFLIWRQLLFGRHGLTPMEQLVAQFWLGADLAAVILFALFCPLLGEAEPESIGQFYAAYAVLRGLVFFIEGRTCWGRLYLVSLVFFAAAILMGMLPRHAPLLYAPLYSGWFLWHSGGAYPVRRTRPRARQAGRRGSPTNEAHVTDGEG
jgi:serine/threonine-protein kinase